jgi:Reverse transcriptase (RNA-dependent DNA polymerase)/Endonuclease-reverse transcriptase
MNQTLKQLKICTWNSRGINNKFHELTLFLRTYHIDIMLATETKLAPHINFYVPGYSIIRADHPSCRRKGGSAIFVRNSIAHDVLPSVIEIEAQVARISLKLNNRYYQIGSFYSAPSCRLTAGILWSIVHELGGHFLLGGDFNSKHPRWGSSTTSPRGRLLHDVAYQLGLEFVYPIQPTHYPDAGYTPDVLDFFISKQTARFCYPPEVLHELSSDHYPVITTLQLKPVMFCPQERLIKYPFNWKTYTKTVDSLVDLQVPLKTPKDIDVAVNTLTKTIQIAASEAHTEYTFPPSYTRHDVTPLHIQQLLDTKKASRRLWEFTKYQPHKRSYNAATRELREALKEHNDLALQDELSALDTQDGSLWRKTKRLTKRREGIPPLKVANTWYTSPQHKADLFSKILIEQFTPHPITNQPFVNSVLETLHAPLQLSPFNTYFTPNQVKEVIERSPPKKAPGYDLIVQPLLKALPKKGLVMLTQIFNAILRTTHFPSKWKHANITMIHKPGKSKSDPKNYRPISLLPLFSKIFERLLLEQLNKNLEMLIPNTQFGFRQFHSCPQQLHRVVDYILDSYEEKKVCLGLFLDTEKAFDKVWHDGLLYKLKNHLPDTYYKLILSYLKNRTYSVKIGNTLSKSNLIKSGVPQGSVLGPFLYIIYTNDFPHSENIKMAHFADDVAALCKAETNLLASQRIQGLANKIEEWCSQWRVAVNPNKSSLVQFTYLRNVDHYPITYKGVPIPYDTSVKYLGLTLDTKLTWAPHIKNTIQKVRTRFYILKHILQHSNTPLHLKRLLYNTIIKPIWQYGAAIWNSAANTHISKVQTIQNRILRMATNAPWYVTNTTIHTDLKIPTITDILQKTYTAHHSRLLQHSNILIQEITQHPPPSRQYRRLKRKRHTDLTPQ